MQARKTNRPCPAASRIVRFASLVVGLLLALSWQSHAQSLGEAAARERERRKEVGKSAPTITDRDLDGGRPASGSSSGSSSVPPSVAPAATPNANAAEPVEQPETFTEEEERQDRLEAWRQMVEGARDEVEQLTTEVDRLQASLNNVTGLYGSARAERIGQVDKAKQDLATSRRALDELERMGRTRGFR
jgi:DNA repair exonuclease SbcCD ATPase subunit